MTRPYGHPRHAWVKLGLVALCTALANFDTAIADVARTFPIYGVDLARNPLNVKPEWKGGILRVTIKNFPTDGTAALHLSYGAGGDIKLDTGQIRARTVLQSSNARTIDLPAINGDSISVVTPSVGLQVTVVGILAPDQFRPEQRIKEVVPLSLTPAATGLEKTYALAFGRLDVYSASAQYILVCTAFRIAKGYWLTAAHCGYRSKENQDGPVLAMWKLHPANWPGDDTGAVFDAMPVASGLQWPAVDPESIMAETDKDYLLLQVDDDPGGPALPLRTDATSADGSPLVLLQHSLGDIPPPAGKAVALGDACKVQVRFGKPDSLDPELCNGGAIQHGCSSQDGASGGPLVKQSNFNLVALHYRAGPPGQFNCGLPASVISQDICKRFPTLAEKVLKCPQN